MGGVHPSFFSLGQASRLFASVSLGGSQTSIGRSTTASRGCLSTMSTVTERVLPVLIAVKPIVGSAGAELDCYIANDA